MPLEPYKTWKITGEKICSLCKNKKKVAEFPWNLIRNAPRPWCNECSATYYSRWRETHKESCQKSDEKYKKNNKPKILQRARPKAREYYNKNKEACLVKRKEYYEKNKESCKIASREAAKKAWFIIGDLVIYRNTVYQVIRRTKGGFLINKIRAHHDDYYFALMPETTIVIRRNLKKLKPSHHEKESI